MSGHNEKEKLLRFEKQAAFFREIKKMGAEKFFAGISSLKKCFSAGKKHLCCMDERTPGGIHLAGSGILLGIDKAAAICRQAKITSITSHDSCGAAAIYKQINNLPGDSNDYAISFAKDLAEKTNLPYAGHLPVKENFHFAMAAYYDGTGIFDWSTLLGEIPAGFFINRKNLERDYAVNTEAKTAIKIAYGDHGYGNLLSETNPFYLIVIGNPLDDACSLDKLKAELLPLKEEFGGEIIIDGFIAPIN